MRSGLGVGDQGKDEDGTVCVPRVKGDLFHLAPDYEFRSGSAHAVHNEIRRRDWIARHKQTSAAGDEVVEEKKKKELMVRSSVKSCFERENLIGIRSRTRVEAQARLQQHQKLPDLP